MPPSSPGHTGVHSPSPHRIAWWLTIVGTTYLLVRILPALLISGGGTP